MIGEIKEKRKMKIQTKKPTNKFNNIEEFFIVLKEEIIEKIKEDIIEKSKMNSEQKRGVLN